MVEACISFSLYAMLLCSIAHVLPHNLKNVQIMFLCMFFNYMLCTLRAARTACTRGRLLGNVENLESRFLAGEAASCFRTTSLMLNFSFLG